MIKTLRRAILDRLFPLGRKRDYERIRFPDYDVLFHLGGLTDRRGIGRMSSELLGELQKLSAASASGSEHGTRPEIPFFSTIHYCPPTLPARSVVYVLDVIPLLFPDLFPSAAKKWRTRYGPKAGQATLVLGISQAGIQDAIRLIPLDPDRTAVVPCGVSQLAEPGANLSEPKSPPYFCFLGSPSLHKNLGVALKALTLMKDCEVELRLIGNRHEDLLPLIRELGLTDRVRLMGRLDDAEVAAQLRGAMALIFPSLYEGFGLPPLEAALLGTPSICSRRPAMTEFLENAALFCEPDSPEAWALAMDRLVSEPELRAEIAGRACSRAQSMTWDYAARALLPHFERMARGE